MTEKDGWTIELSKAEAEALATLPLPGWHADRVFMGRGVQRSYSSIWRKSSAHYDAMLKLERRGIVERKVSCGETLWRPTKPYGLMVRQSLPTPPAESDA